MKKDDKGLACQPDEALHGQGNMMNNSNRGRKKIISEGYVRADNVDKKQLRKYIKAVEKEAEMHRNARQRSENCS